MRRSIGELEGAFEWLSPADARFLAQSIQRIARNEAQKAVAEQAGATRDIAWSASAPEVSETAEDPPPYPITRNCKPSEVLASCLTAPTTNLFIDVQRSIDGGDTFESILQAPATISAGNKTGYGGTFLWENSLTRELVPPFTQGAFPVQLLIGDIVDINLSGGTGIKSLSVLLRTERIDEHTRRRIRW